MINRIILNLLIVSVISCTSYNPEKLIFREVKCKGECNPIILYDEKQPNLFIKDDFLTIYYPFSFELTNNTGKKIDFGYGIGVNSRFSILEIERHDSIVLSKEFYNKNGRFHINNQEKKTFTSYFEIEIPKKNIDTMSLKRDKFQRLSQQFKYKKLKNHNIQWEQLNLDNMILSLTYQYNKNKLVLLN